MLFMDTPQFVDPLRRRVKAFKPGKFITVGQSLATDVDEDVPGLSTLLKQPSKNTNVDEHTDSSSSASSVHGEAHSRALYRVLWGAVHIVVRGQVVCVLSNGEYFGEMYALGLEPVSSVTARSAERGCGIEILEGAICPEVKKALSEVRHEDCLPCPSSKDIPLNMNGSSLIPQLHAHNYLYPRVLLKGVHLQIDNEDAVPIALVLLRYGSLAQDTVDDDGRVIRFRTIDAPAVLPMHSFFFLDPQPYISYHVTSTIAFMYFLPKDAVPALLNANDITRKAKPWTWFGGTHVPGMTVFSNLDVGRMTTKVSYLYPPMSGNLRRRSTHDFVRFSAQKWRRYAAGRTGRAKPAAPDNYVSERGARSSTVTPPMVPDPTVPARRNVEVWHTGLPSYRYSCTRAAPDDTCAHAMKTASKTGEKRETVRFRSTRTCTPGAHELLTPARASLLPDLPDGVSEVSSARLRKTSTVRLSRPSVADASSCTRIKSVSPSKSGDGTPRRLCREGSRKGASFRWSKKADGDEHGVRPTLDSLTYMWSLFYPEPMEGRHAGTRADDAKPSTPLTVPAARHKAASAYLSVLDLFNRRGAVPEFVVSHVEERVVCPNTKLPLHNMLVLIAHGSAHAVGADGRDRGVFGPSSAFGAIPSLCLAANTDVASLHTAEDEIAFIMVIHPQVVLHAMTVDALASTSHVLAHCMPNVCVLPCDTILPYMLCAEHGGVDAALFLRNASVHFLRRLAASAEMRFYIPGDCIVTEGDISDELFILLRPNETPRILQEANMLGLHTLAPETVEVSGDTPWACYVLSHGVFAMMLKRAKDDDFRVLHHLFECFFPASTWHSLVASLHLDAHTERALLRGSEIFVALPGTVDTSRGPIVLAWGRAVVVVEDTHGREVLHTLEGPSRLFYCGTLPLEVCAMSICVFLQLSSTTVGMEIITKQSEEAVRSLSAAISKRAQDKLITQLHMWPYPTDKSLLRPYFRAWRRGTVKPRVKKEYKRSIKFLTKQNGYLSKLVSKRFRHKALLGYVTHRGAVGVKCYNALKRSYARDDKSAKQYTAQRAQCSVMQSVYEVPAHPRMHRTPRRAHAVRHHPITSVHSVDDHSRYDTVLDEPSAIEVEPRLPSVHVSVRSHCSSPRSRRQGAVEEETMWHKCNSHVLDVLLDNDAIRHDGATSHSPWLLPNRTAVTNPP